MEQNCDACFFLPMHTSPVEDWLKEVIGRSMQCCDGQSLVPRTGAQSKRTLSRRDLPVCLSC